MSSDLAAALTALALAVAMGIREWVRRSRRDDRPRRKRRKTATAVTENE